MAKTSKLQVTDRDVAKRLRVFDAATARQKKRQRAVRSRQRPRDRGWTRAELYERGGVAG